MPGGMTTSSSGSRSGSRGGMRDRDAALRGQDPRDPSLPHSMSHGSHSSHGSRGGSREQDPRERSGSGERWRDGSRERDGLRERDAAQEQMEPKKMPVTVAELALIAKVRRGAPKVVDFDTATDAVTWALEVSGRGPTGVREKQPYIKLAPWCRAFGAVVVGSIAVFILLRVITASFREVSAQDGLMLAAGVPAHQTGKPLAAVAAPFEQRNLTSCPSLPREVLMRMRDVAINTTHDGSWMNLRIAHVQSFSDHHLWLQAFDGTGVRVLGGRLFYREGALGDEVLLGAGAEHATAYFEVVVEGAVS